MPLAPALLVTSIGFALIGLLDDLRGTSPLFRLGIQAFLTGVALPWLVRDVTGSSLWIALLVGGVFVWLLAYVNAFNFMDGINGISVTQVVVAGGTWLLIARARHLLGLEEASAIVALAAVGFAPFNFPRARIFLGDVGSYFLGVWLAVLAVFALRAGVPPEAVLAPLALYLVDTGTTLIRRIARGDTWCIPHKEHVYQRLTQSGWTHARTTVSVFGIMAAASGLGALSLIGSLPVRIIGDGALAFLLLTYVNLPRLLARRRTSRKQLSS